jgi:malate dehydrogenase
VSQVAIIGAGAVGASIAHRLAARGRVGAIALIDSNGPLAAGKALDISQSGPVDHFDTPIAAAADPLSASASAIIVVADDAASGPWEGERGLALMQQIARAGSTAAIVFACPAQTWLMEKCFGELGMAAHRLVGSAAGAVVGSVRALAGLELGMASVDLAVVGRPPALVVGWTAATADGSLLTDLVPAHRLLAITQALPKLWPPQPYAIASATARLVEALLHGSRHRWPALTIVDGDLGARGKAVLLPLRLGDARVLDYAVPSLSPQERTELLTSVQSR